MPLYNYVMFAEENYAPAFVTAFNGGNKLFANQDTYQQTPGATFDYVRRSILYNAAPYNAGALLNPTGHALWSGQNLIAVGDTIDQPNQKNLQVCQKNIDNNIVTWNDCYGPAQLVPNGLQLGLTGTLAGGAAYVNGTYIGVPLTGGTGTGAYANMVVSGGAVTAIVKVYNPNGGYIVGDVLSASNVNLGGAGAGFTYTVGAIAGVSDGTYRRFVESGGQAFPQLVDPRTGDTWLHVESSAGSVHCTVYKFQLSDGFQQIISPLFPLRSSSMHPIGISDAWVYVVEVGGAGAVSYHLSLTPRTIQARETAADFLLTYANFDFPAAFDAMEFGPNAFAFTQSTTVYFVKAAMSYSELSVTRAYKLYRFTEPTAVVYGGAITGGGFADVTPWAAGTGPNTNAAAYIYNPTFGRTKANYPIYEFVYYLPSQNQVGILSKFFSWQTSADYVSDPALTFFDFTFFDINGGTFDYHHAFVKGYMSSAWAPLSSSTGAAWVVIDALQINSFPAYNSYLFSGHDYTKIWLAFIVQPADAAFPPDPAVRHTIFVQYQLTYGSAPTVLQVIGEAGWDAKYATYGAAIGNANVVWNSQGITNQDTITDAGIYDPKGKAFWWGGDINLLNFNTKLAGPRTSPPFLKLQIHPIASYCVPFAVGSTYCSQGQILRPAAPQESGSQSGPSQGKKRRMVYAAPLLEGTQGMSMGVDFLLMRPLEFKSPGGTVSLTLQETFSGVYWSTVDAGFNYDNMWCWEVCRPYPCTVVSVECQLETNENL